MNINVGESEGRGQEMRKRLMRREEEALRENVGKGRDTCAVKVEGVEGCKWELGEIS